jgi:uncharacterized membrane protein
MSRVALWLGRAAIAAVMIAYPVLAYVVTVTPGEPGFGAIVVATAPPAGVVLAMCWRSGWRVPAVVLCGALFVALRLYADQLGQHLPLLYFVQHAGTNAALLVLFGRTLRAGREPLCSRFAATMRGPLEPRVARYTRQVTVAWTLFFAAMTLASILLYAAGPLEIWSAFANLLTLPLVVAMFVVEYAIRLRVLPDIPHASIMSAVRAYWSAQSAPTPPPR